jgi:putative heme-binding domain-containing protein
MCNTHGRRVNVDDIEPKGAGFTAVHRPDFLTVNNPWFRGVQMAYGPDGGVYITDWSDFGECHDHDGVHRTSGRMFKIVYGDAPKLPAFNLAKLGTKALVDLHAHKNQWYVRHARRILQERAAAATAVAIVELREMMNDANRTEAPLNALWSMHALGCLRSDDLKDVIINGRETHAVAALRMLGDGTPGTFLEGSLTNRMMLEYASVLQKMPAQKAWSLAEELVTQKALSDDKDFPLMVWFGIERLIPQDRTRALALFDRCEIPLVKMHIARRLTFDITEHPEPVNQLVARLDGPNGAAIIAGMSEALRGFGQVKAPQDWAEKSTLVKTPEQGQLDALSRVFGGGVSLDELNKAAVNKQLPLQARKNAIHSMGVLKDVRSPKLLFTLLGDRDLQIAAIEALGEFDEPTIGGRLVQSYSRFKDPARKAVMPVFVSRKENARALLAAIADGKIPREALSAFYARQIVTLNDEGLDALLKQHWGNVATSSAEKLAELKRYEAWLTPERLSEASAPRGRSLFQSSCSACHRLFGEGGAIGPDLTGADRGSLYYLLENIIDPSSVVPLAYKMHVVYRQNESIVSGAKFEENERVLGIQTLSDKVYVPRTEIARVEVVEQSTMPEGLLQALSDTQVLDLIAYLQSKNQVAPAK